MKFSVRPYRSGISLSVTNGTSEICFQNVNFEFVSRMINAIDNKHVCIELSNNQSARLQSMIKCG